MEQKIVEVPVVKDEQLEIMSDLAEEIHGIENNYRTLVAEISNAFGLPIEKLKQESSNLRTTIEQANMLRKRMWPNTVGIDRSNGKDWSAFTKVEKRGEKFVVTNSGTISGPEQRILDALAWFESIGQFSPLQTAVAFLSGYTYGGGAFNNPRGALRSKGLVEYRGNAMALTEDGRQIANQPVTPLTIDEIQAHVNGVLPGPERKILSVLLGSFPEALDKADLAHEAGYKEGGAFNNPLGRLRTLGLIEYPRWSKK